jgi:PEP-CTERM motif
MGQEGVNVRRLLTASLCLAACLALASPARAAVFTYTSAGASVTFTTSATQITVHLVNTDGDALQPTDILTAVFFSCTGCGTLTPVSAITSGDTYLGSSVLLASGSSVGTEWEYLAGLNQYGQTAGISSTGLGIFGNGNFAPGGDALDGPGWGIVSASDNPATGNGGVTGVPVTHDDVNFVLSCSTNCSGATFGTSVTFQYGTALTEPSVGGTGPGGQNLVPEPTSLLLFGSGLAMTAYRARRKKLQKKDN